MINRLARGLAGVTLFGLCLCSSGCRGKAAQTVPETVVGSTDHTHPGPGDPDCYKTAGAVACPPDLKDPSIKHLPTPGGVCNLSVCSVCGSATEPSFRDATGAVQPGWCICVATSDGSGAYSYSCFTPAQWSSQPH